MRILITGLIVVSLAACNSGNKSEDQAFVEALDEAGLESQIVSEEVKDILYRIPSPLEISVMLKQADNKYDPSLLNATDHASRYSTNYQKALNLGIYGTDLGYTNVYERSQDGIRYMTAVTTLARELNIGQFFEAETMGRLVSNSQNMDSLLLITTQNFNRINHYLLSQNRGHLTVLLLTGGWIEALHITCKVAEQFPDNKQLQETIGGQKIILDNLLQLLTYFKDNDKSIPGLLTDLTPLKEAFDKVSIITVYQPSTYEVVDGVMVVRDNSASTIEISPADIEKIRTSTERIRNKIIS